MRRRIAARAAPHQAARARRTPRRDARAAAPLRQAPARRSRAREGVALSCSRALSCDVRRDSRARLWLCAAGAALVRGSVIY